MLRAGCFWGWKQSSLFNYLLCMFLFYVVRMVKMGNFLMLLKPVWGPTTNPAPSEPHCSFPMQQPPQPTTTGTPPHHRAPPAPTNHRPGGPPTPPAPILEARGAGTLTHGDVEGRRLGLLLLETASGGVRGCCGAASGGPQSLWGGWGGGICLRRRRPRPPSQAPPTSRPALLGHAPSR